MRSSSQPGRGRRPPDLILRTAAAHGLGRPPHVPEALEPRRLLAVNPVGSEFRVNTFTAGSQERAAVAADADGDFVVAWTSYEQDGSDAGIYAQRYTADGTPAGAEFRVNTFTAGKQFAPDVAMGDDGDFVVIWHSPGRGLYAQRYTADGTPAGGEFRVSTATYGQASVSMDAGGNFVVAWDRPGDGHLTGIFAQRFTPDGAPAGGEFQDNTTTY